jgi:hypothetical protein
VSDGGDERPAALGLRTACELGAWRPFPFSIGETVSSLKSSEAVDSLWVTGEGRWPCLRRLAGGDRRPWRAFLGSTCSPCDCCERPSQRAIPSRISYDICAHTRPRLS